MQISARLTRYGVLPLLASAAMPMLAQSPYATSLEPGTVLHDIPANRGSAAVLQSLRKLHTRASVIMITAHPDDEDGGMLTYQSRGKGARVTLLTLNRGEGGANVMSPDYFDALALVRTEELLTAGRHYGVDQYWTRMIDYGFSKTMDESLGKWTKERVLYDVVRVVRITRPLVVTSVFVGALSDGHGNHQVAGLMAKEVFQAAGDPNVFPDQIQAGLRPWNPMKQYARLPFSRRAAAAPTGFALMVPSGTYDPALGMSYAQLAREGLGYQKSQTGGPIWIAAGEQNTPYRRVASKVSVQESEQSFFDGIDTSLMGIATLAEGGGAGFLQQGLTELNGHVEKAMASFNAVQPEAIAPLLALGKQRVDRLLAEVEKSGLNADAKYNVSHELKIKQVQFNHALALALGLSVRATVAPAQEPTGPFAMMMGDPDTPRAATPGQRLAVKASVVNQSGAAVKLVSLKVAPQTGGTWQMPQAAATAQALAMGKPVSQRFEVQIPADAPLTRPYFTRPDIEQPYYDVKEMAYLNRPLMPYPLAVEAVVEYEGVPVQCSQVVQSVKRAAGYGQVFEPLTIAPALAVAISPRAGILPVGQKSFPVRATVRSNVTGGAEGTVRLDLPSGWRSEPASHAFKTLKEGDELSVQFTVQPSTLSTQPYTLTAVAETGGKQYREGYSLTGYAGLRPQFLYTSAQYRTSGVDVKIAPSLRVGYITGSGDDVPASLGSLGVTPTFLGPSDVASGDLSRFNVILLGVRTYAVRDELRTYNNRLLEYVKNGGVVIVQYNTPEFDQNYGPYPYVMGRNPEEVTDEASKVELLIPNHPVFSWPNKITAADFEHWVEERGSKWLQSWDSHYEALLETHDKDQEPQKGGLLFARYGKGAYVYNAYALYRQLPDGVPGAYRLMANLLSLPQNPALKSGAPQATASSPSAAGRVR